MEEQATAWEKIFGKHVSDWYLKYANVILLLFKTPEISVLMVYHFRENHHWFYVFETQNYVLAHTSMVGYFSWIQPGGSSTGFP